MTQKRISKHTQTYTRARAHTHTSVAHTDILRDFLAVGEAFVAMFRPTPPRIKREHLSALVSQQRAPGFLRPRNPTAGSNILKPKKKQSTLPISVFFFNPPPPPPPPPPDLSSFLSCRPRSCWWLFWHFRNKKQEKKKKKATFQLWSQVLKLAVSSPPSPPLLLSLKNNNNKKLVDWSVGGKICFPSPFLSASVSKRRSNQKAVYLSLTHAIRASSSS